MKVSQSPVLGHSWVQVCLVKMQLVLAVYDFSLSSGIGKMYLQYVLVKVTGTINRPCS